MLREARGTVLLAERLAHDPHPVSAFVVVLLFALANAGISLEPGCWPGRGGAVLGGVLAGRVVGKLAGITAAAWLAVRLGLAARPWDHLAPAGRGHGGRDRLHRAAVRGRPGLPRRRLPGLGARPAAGLAGRWRKALVLVLAAWRQPV